MCIKRFFSLALCIVFSMQVAYSRYIGDVNGNGDISLADVTELVNLVLDNPETNYSIYADVNCDGLLSIADVEELINIILGKSTAEEPGTITIAYTDDGATYTIPAAWANHVSISVTEGHASVTNNNTTDECTLSLSGSCSDGSFTYTGNYKTTLVLNGLSLTNTDGAAMAIKCGKRIALELAEGTENTLADGGSNSLKGALYCKGHIEVSKGGSLTVTGNTKHGITSKEYILLKKTMGSLTIDGAAGDGIHVEQYFQMNGGTLTVSGVSSDGIQAELKGDASEDDGKVIIKGGTLNIEVQGASSAALKSDSTLHITDGNITIVTTGDSDKALSSDGNIEINGGTIDITQSGGYTVETVVDDNGDTVYDPSYVVGLKADSCIVITDGTLTVTNTASGGRGMKADRNINIEGGTLTVYANGEGGVLDTSSASSGSTESTASYELYFSLPSTATSSNTGGGNMGPGGSSSTTTFSWSDVKLYTSSGTLVATFSSQSSISGSDGTTLTFYVYDFGAATSGSYYVTASYTTTSTGGMGGPGGGSSTSSGTYTSSTFTLDLTGSNVYKSVTATSSSSGGGGFNPGGSSTSFTFTLSDVTSNFANGSVATEEGDTYSAAGVKADGNITLNGGTLTIAHNGASSKGIKADGTVTLSGTTVADAARGTYLVVGSDASYCTSVKCGSYEGTDGSLTVEATGAASRGISSDGTFSITGGTYDLTLSGDGAVMPSDSSEGIGSVGFKSDGNMTLTGGTITIDNTAKGGKGIKVGNSTTASTLIIGTSGADNDLLSLDVNTKGECISTVSSSSGMGGGPSEESFVGSAKAVKVMGAITVNSGNIHLSTASDGAEGLESKSTITFNGGIFESDTYDDAINAGSTITFNDGYVWAHASDNDAIDSNSSSGTNGIVINGGVVIGTSTTDPEEAFDCDNANFVLNGGILIGVGGAQGGGGGTSTAGAPTSAAQAYAVVSGVSLTQDTYISVKDSSGTVLCSYKQPNNFTSSGGMGGGSSSSSVNILVSHPSLSGSGTVVYNSTAISGGSNSLWDGVYTTGATLTGGTSTSVTASK